VFLLQLECQLFGGTNQNLKSHTASPPITTGMQTHAFGSGLLCNNTASVFGPRAFFELDTNPTRIFPGMLGKTPQIRPGAVTEPK